MMMDPLNYHLGRKAMEQVAHDQLYGATENTPAVPERISLLLWLWARRPVLRIRRDKPAQPPHPAADRAEAV
jgi:hypothetical protein